MPQLLSKLQDDVKDSIRSLTGVIEIISSAVLTLSGLAAFLFNNLDKWIADDYALLAKLFIVYLGLLVSFNKLCRIIISREKPASTILIPGDKQEEYVYTKPQRRAARMLQYVSMGGIAVFLVAAIWIHFNNSNVCLEKSRKLGVFVMNFSSASQDEFSTSLLNDLASSISDSTVSLEYPNRFLPIASRLEYMKSIVPILNCYDSGMVVFGSRNIQEKSFTCNIFLHNMTVACSRLQLKNKIITVKDPSLIELSNTTMQADRISRFIQGIIWMYKCLQQQALTQFSAILSHDDFKEDRQIQAFCYFFKGNIYYRSNVLDSAKLNYEQALLLDSSINELKLNYASLLDNFQDVKDIVEIKDTVDKTEQKANNDTKIRLPNQARVPYSKLSEPYLVDAEIEFVDSSKYTKPLSDVEVWNEFRVFNVSFYTIHEAMYKLHFTKNPEESFGKCTIKLKVDPEYYYYDRRFRRNIPSEPYDSTDEQKGITKDDWKNFGTCLCTFYNTQKNDPKSSIAVEVQFLHIKVSLRFSDNSILVLPDNQVFRRWPDYF